MKPRVKKSIVASIKQFFNNNMVQYSMVLFVIMFALMTVIFVAERNSNSAINTYFDAFWYTLVTITTVGYGDITPATVIGRLAGLSLLLFGVVTFGAISGKVASVLFDQQLKKDRGLIQLKKISNHFLICGWKPDFERILDGVLLANPDIPLELFVLINNAPSEQMDRIKAEPRFHGINYLSGDYTDEATLLRANIKTAERVLILADYSQNFSPLEIDSRTVLAVLTIGSLNPKIYSAAEILDAKFERHLAVAHCDEIILTRDYERSLLVSASSGMGLSHVLRDLITEASGEGLVIGDIDPEFVGKTYKDFRDSLAGPKVLIGVLENTGNFYHRRREALAEAQKNPDMKGIVTNLKKVKLLRSNEPVLTPPDEYVIPANAKAIFVCGHQVTDKKLESENAE